MMARRILPSKFFYSALKQLKAKMPNEEKSALEIWKLRSTTFPQIQ